MIDRINKNISAPAKREAPPVNIAITDLLPRYYEAYGNDQVYTPMQSWVIDGHEIAWMKINGNIIADLSGQGREGESYEVFDLCCACDFSEGIGWYQHDDGKPVGLSWGEKCTGKEKVLDARHAELHQEYIEKGWLTPNDHPVQADEATVVMLDLMQRVAQGEFIESGNGAAFWGGYYYLQTSAEVLGISMHDMWPLATKMEQDKVITLEGAVVQEYREPKPPTWEPYLHYELDGWIATASLPTHSKMPQTWKFTVNNPQGEQVDMEIPDVPLMYMPDFGPDMEDTDTAKELLIEILGEILNK